MSAPPAPAYPLLLDGSNAQTMGNRFLLSVIAFQRSKQLHGGAVARVPRGSHKSTYIAVLEVLDNTISWSRD